MTQRVNLSPTCAKCGRTHLGNCHDWSKGCFKCEKEGQFIKECPKNQQGNLNPIVHNLH